MENMVLFKDRVRALRRGAHLSQQQLGEVLGLTHKSISMIESGDRGTTVEKLVLLAKYFHVSTDYLLGITDDPTWRGTWEGSNDSPRQMSESKSNVERTPFNVTMSVVP